jgi:hypothetical protein
MANDSFRDCDRLTLVTGTEPFSGTEPFTGTELAGAFSVEICTSITTCFRELERPVGLNTPILTETFC